MNAQELRVKNESELRKKLTGLLQEQFNLRMQRGTGQLASPHELRRVKKDIARVQTVLSEKRKTGETS